MAMFSGTQVRSEPDDQTEQLPTVTTSVPVPRRRRVTGRRVLAVIGVLVLAGAGVGTWLATRKSGSTAALTVTTETVPVTTGTMQATVATSGTIQPGSEASLNFAVSGQVTAVKVTAGDKVTAGQPLATINSSALQAQLASAKASLSSAQAKLSSDRTADATASQIDSDEASVTSAGTQVTSDQTDVDDASLTSTITGTVAAVNLTVGQQVSAGSTSASSGASTATSSSGTSSSDQSSGSTASGSTGSGTSSGASSTATSSGSSSSSSSAEITVIDTKSFTVATTIDDTEVGQVMVGDQAVITPGSSTTNVYGTVSSVGVIATTTSNVATFPVVVAVTGTPSGLFPGATATVSIITKQINNAVEVPTAAISYSSGKATVTGIKGTKHVVTAVTTGVSNNGETQITSGVTAGTKVVERIVRFNTSAGGTRSLFGGTGTGTSRTYGGGTYRSGSYTGGSSSSGGSTGG